MRNTITFSPPRLPELRPLRERITEATLLPETEIVPALVAAAELPEAARKKIASVAASIVEAMRSGASSLSLQQLTQAYSPAGAENLALMGIAEALLRTPDGAGKDALLRDKIVGRKWSDARQRDVVTRVAGAALGIAGRILDEPEGAYGSAPEGKGALLRRLVRAAADRGVAQLGTTFVCAETIEEALARNSSRRRNLHYSYDMLGEAAVTTKQAKSYLERYGQAIEALGAHPSKHGDSISIKLSSLHPRYERAKAELLQDELYPRVFSLAARAAELGIALTIDAEEAERLDISLDLFERLATDARLPASWAGLGFVVQAYSKRALPVIDYLVALARHAGRRICIRLVKGAYWDSEIKRAQVLGLPDFPVFTRKIHTDVSYLAAARRLFDANGIVFPQFATHNAHTIASILAMAPTGEQQSFEFQCLYGMGEPVYAGLDSIGIDRTLRVYAPVGTHEDLLAYLVRRLLENSANSSFISKVFDPQTSVRDLVADPVEASKLARPVGKPHAGIRRAPDLYGRRRNSDGADLSNEGTLARLDALFAGSERRQWHARPQTAAEVATKRRPIANPADSRDLVGDVDEIVAESVPAIFAAASTEEWTALGGEGRSAVLLKAADLLQAEMDSLLPLIVREAGKSIPNAISEVREAIDYLRFYALEARRAEDARPLGTVVCISPWNFPLAIFVGQVAGSLAAGNAVIAKPAKDTPLIAYQAIVALHAAGVPRSALQFVPGDGSAVGTALVADPRCSGVVFTGSLGVAAGINRRLAGHLTPSGDLPVLVAETGGLNAMIVDSTALPEQVARDVITSAFDSAGQRCSALRILYLQEEIADRVIDLACDALETLTVSNPADLASDVGPVINAASRSDIEAHVAEMERQGARVSRAPLGPNADRGHFVRPTVIELPKASLLQREVFGPVLHVVRYPRNELPSVVDEIAGTGYGLTFGIQTRVDARATAVADKIGAGNVYVNRNTIGAVVGSQPFGGQGLSGTGPKAGGPLYVARLRRETPVRGGDPTPAFPLPPVLATYRDWLLRRKEVEVAAACIRFANAVSNLDATLPGPELESNVYRVSPRKGVLAIAATEHGLLLQIAVALAAGIEVIQLESSFVALVSALPEEVRRRIRQERVFGTGLYDTALVEAAPQAAIEIAGAIAAQRGGIVTVQVRTPDQIRAGELFDPRWLLHEQSICTNTAVNGGGSELVNRQEAAAAIS